MRFSNHREYGNSHRLLRGKRLCAGTERQHQDDRIGRRLPGRLEPDSQLDMAGVFIVGGNPTAAIVQIGNYNATGILQFGGTTSASVGQTGISNFTFVGQSGQSTSSVLSQFGNINSRSHRAARLHELVARRSGRSVSS